MARKMIKNLKFQRKKNSVYTVALERDENNRCKITKGKESIFVNCNPKVKLPITLNLPKTYTGRWPPDPKFLVSLLLNKLNSKH